MIKYAGVMKDPEGRGGVHGFPDPEKERIFYRSLSDFLLKNLPVD